MMKPAFDEETGRYELRDMCDADARDGADPARDEFDAEDQRREEEGEVRL